MSGLRPCFSSMINCKSPGDLIPPTIKDTPDGRLYIMKSSSAPPSPLSVTSILLSRLQKTEALKCIHIGKSAVGKSESRRKRPPKNDLRALDAKLDEPKKTLAAEERCVAPSNPSFSSLLTLFLVNPQPAFLVLAAHRSCPRRRPRGRRKRTRNSRPPDSNRKSPPPW